MNQLFGFRADSGGQIENGIVTVHLGYSHGHFTMRLGQVLEPVVVEVAAQAGGSHPGNRDSVSGSPPPDRPAAVGDPSPFAGSGLLEASGLLGGIPAHVNAAEANRLHSWRHLACEFSHTNRGGMLVPTETS